MLRLTKSTVAAVLRHAASEPDREVCGLVWASEMPGAFRQTAHPLPNVHPDPSKYYRTAPKDVREAFALMDQQGGSPIAWYHSHPGGKADPSEEDMHGAFNTGMFYLIAYPERQDLRDGFGGLIGQVSDWQLGVWECLEPGVLVGADYLVES